MKKTYKRIFQAVICLGVCAMMLIGGLISGTAENTEAVDPFDYSLRALEHKQSLSASELFYRICGFYPSDLERAYLDGLSGITFRYNDLIPVGIVSTDYNGETGVLRVTVPTYQYTASNGATVEWIPQTATLDGMEKPLLKSGEEYSCQFEDLLYSMDFDIYVSFEWSVDLPDETVELLLNKPYTEGSKALETLVAYEEDCLKPYFEALKRYEEYEVYKGELEVYSQYLADLALYERNLASYRAYLDACDQYLKDQDAYNAYLQNKALWDQYYVYLDFKKNDLEKYNEYLIYQSTVSKVLSKLSVLESLFVTDSNGWTFYPSLMGNTVTSVISRKDELITGGCNEKDIVNADRATVDLRVLLTEYSNLRKQTYASEHDKTAALYAYYTAHYTELRDSFALLYGSLIALYDNEFVVIYADKEGKLERFQQFMGQLYVTTTCLDDSDKGMRMENWKISGKSLSTVVEAINLIPDTGHSDPAGVFMPEKEVARIEPVAPVEKPSVRLPAVSKPQEPVPVEEPQAPTPMAEPEAKPKAEHPGEIPPEPSMEDTLRDLAMEIQAGRLTKRETAGISGQLSFQKSIVCPISIHNLKTVTFYDLDGETILYQQKVNYGESVTYGGPETYKSDPYYVYSFQGWMLSDGSEATFDEVRENLSVFANYKIEPRLYKILWILDGVEKETYHRYGENPVSPFPLQKPDGVGVTYQFTGWDKEVVAVDGDAVYVGGFEAIPKVYTVTWITHSEQLTQTLTYGETASFPSDPLSYFDNLSYYEFIGWDKDIHAPITGNRTFYARYSQKNWATTKNQVPLEITNDGSTLTVLAMGSDVILPTAIQYAKTNGLSLVIRWKDFSVRYSRQGLKALADSECDRISLRQKNDANGVVYTVGYQDAAEKEIGAKIAASLILYPLNEDGSGCVYAIQDVNGWKELEGTSYEIFGSATLLVKQAYRIFAQSNELCNVSALPLYAIPGQWINLEIECDFGYEIVGATLTYNGKETPLKGTKLQMPAGDVTIALKVERIIYHVTFEVDGEAYSQADYFLGEEILLPEHPQKAQDSTYSYEFLEWSPTVTIAMGEDREITYRAVFSKNLLNGVDPYHSGNNNNRLLNTFLPIGLGVLAVGIGIFVLLRVLKKRRLAAKVSKMDDENREA